MVLILALALRLGFAFGSTHWFGRQVASFSVQHHVGPDTYAAAFVLMVLVMIAVRTAAVIIRGHAAGANIDWTRLPAARRLGA